jgi:hypothetical protein
LVDPNLDVTALALKLHAIQLNARIDSSHVRR